MRRIFSGRSFTFLCAATLLPLLGERATAQSMSFSVYHDAYVSAGTVFHYADVIDSSNGCSHSSYSTTAKIYSPSNRMSSAQSSGLQANTQLSLNAEFGTYTLVVNGTYHCGCFQQTIGFGGGSSLPIPPPPGPPTLTIESDTGTYNETIGGFLSRKKVRWWSVRRSWDGTLWPYGGVASEQWSNLTNSCGIVIGSLNGTMELDQYSRFFDEYFAPHYELCTQGCTVTGTQRYSLSTYSGGSFWTNTVDYTCASIEVVPW